MNNTPNPTYDYQNQAWIKDGVYQDCGHPQPGEKTLLGEVWEGCNCYGRQHAGEAAQAAYVNTQGHIVYA